MSDKLNEILKERIENIVPDDGAGERMLENIRRKAANGQDSGNNKVILWKKIIKFAAPVAACIAVVIIVNHMHGRLDVTSDSTKTAARDNAAIMEGVCTAQPPKAVSAEQVKESLGIEFTIPEDAYDAEYFIAAEDEAYVRFLYNGHQYEVRAYKNDAQAESNSAGDELFYRATWTKGELTYMLINADGADKADIDTVYNETKSDEN